LAIFQKLLSGKYFEAKKAFGEDRGAKISKALEDLKTV
jgi:hypothetical protein